MSTPGIRCSVALLAVLALLGGCGEDAPTNPAPEVGAEPGRVSTDELLAALSTRVTDGRGISDATWTRDVQEAGMALWPDDADPEHLTARRDHTNLTHIAGDMAGRLAGNEEARADWLATDPISVRVHDGFVEASAAGASAYRAWVIGGGRALIEERFALLQGDAPPR